MIKRDLILPPEILYPIEEWRWVESALSSQFLAQAETIFTVSNGYLGLRGAFEEGSPAYRHGTFVNGFHETWPISYAEGAFGFTTNLPDPKITRLYVDDEPFNVSIARILRYERALDMQAGTLDRQVLWETADGRQLLVESRRLVSFFEKHVAAIFYRGTVLNAGAALGLSSEIVEHPLPEKNEYNDARLAQGIADQALCQQMAEGRGQRVILGYRTKRSGMVLACGMDHTLETDCVSSPEAKWGEQGAQVVFLIDAEPNKPIALTKYITYHSFSSNETGEFCTRAGRTLNRVVHHGFEQLLANQRVYLDDFWKQSDIQISAQPPRLQQCLRWNLFQLIQASGRADDTGIAAKRLTSQTYDGHYFWDMEMYVLPFLIYTSPQLARNILRYRYSILDKARERARTVNQKGALFPWRTINGEEASAYYTAGTAQYYINAAIAHGIIKYVDIIGDQDFLYEWGAKILVETARLWFDLGFFSERQDRHFCIHRVTGPDEYTTVVNNNAYTNFMARENLRFAADTVDKIQESSEKHYHALVLRTELKPGEVSDWRRAAEQMYISFDTRLQIHPQDDQFLDLEPWDFQNTPLDKYPLLLNFHPLVIYWHQVIKQADIVLAMFLLGHAFTLEQKNRNFDYYDELTTDDSSPSVRDYGGRLTFYPNKKVQFLQFRLTIRGQILTVEIKEGRVTYRLEQGEKLTIYHKDERSLIYNQGSQFTDLKIEFILKIHVRTHGIPC